MTPEGHTLSAWITFSAYRDGDVTVAQAQALERTVRPVRRDRLHPGRQQLNNRFWQRDAAQPREARRASRSRWSTPRSSASTSNRQWRHARNVRNSATLRTARHTLTAPVRWITAARGDGRRTRAAGGRRATAPSARCHRRRGRPQRAGRGAHPGPCRPLRPRLRGRADTIGGGTRTQELTLPGFRHDVCSTILPLTAGLAVLPDRGPGRARRGARPPGCAASPTRSTAAGRRCWSARSRPPAAGFDGRRTTRRPGGAVRAARARRREARPESCSGRSSTCHAIRSRSMRFGLPALRSASGLARGRFRGEAARALVRRARRALDARPRAPADGLVRARPRHVRARRRLADGPRRLGGGGRRRWPPSSGRPAARS